MELMPLWQLVAMSMGRLHAQFDGLEPCISPFFNGFCDFCCFHYRKTIENGQNLNFHQKSAYELASLMSNHTDLADKRVDEPFNNLDNIAPHCGDKKGSRQG